MISPPLARCVASLILICAAGRGSTIDLSNYPLLARFHSDGQYNLSGLTSWNAQPVRPSNVPNPYQRELSATFSFYSDLTALNVVYLQISDLMTTNGAWWTGTAFDAVTLTGVRVSNTDPVLVMGFSNAFANPNQILAAGGASSEMVSRLQTTPGYMLSQASNQFSVHTVNQADYGFTSLGNIMGANRIRGGGVFQLTFAPYINSAGFDFDFWNVQAVYGNGTQSIDAEIVTPTPEPSGLGLIAVGLLGVAAIQRCLKFRECRRQLARKLYL